MNVEKKNLRFCYKKQNCIDDCKMCATLFNFLKPIQTRNPDPERLFS